MTHSAVKLEQLLNAASQGDRSAVSQLIPIVYEELRRLARRYLHRENQYTLQATALVHEAYLRLLGDRNLNWNDRSHFLAIAARSMRQILVERARARATQKRGGNLQVVTLTDRILGEAERSVDLLDLDRALRDLGELDSKQAHLVELRFFAGLTIEEAAYAMDISPATAKRWWALSKAWLRREMNH